MIGYIAAEAIPVDFITPTAISGSMPPGLANHAATVALFGKPSNECLNWIDEHERITDRQRGMVLATHCRPSSMPYDGNLLARHSPNTSASYALRHKLFPAVSLPCVVTG